MSNDSTTSGLSGERRAAIRARLEKCLKDHDHADDFIVHAPVDVRDLLAAVDHITHERDDLLERRDILRDAYHESQGLHAYSVQRAETSEAAIAVLTQERDRFKAEAEDWHLAADGIKHHFGCANNVVTGDQRGHVCDRCRAEQAEAALVVLTHRQEALRKALIGLQTIPAEDTTDPADRCWCGAHITGASHADYCVNALRALAGDGDTT